MKIPKSKLWKECYAADFERTKAIIADIESLTKKYRTELPDLQNKILLTYKVHSKINKPSKPATNETTLRQQCPIITSVQAEISTDSGEGPDSPAE